MGNWSIDCDAPEYLILLAFLPLFWFVGRRSLTSLGSWRRGAALTLRLLVAGLLIVALAEPNWLQLSRRLAVMFLVDGSDSVGRDALDQSLDYVNRAVAEQRNEARGDRAGVIAFGRDAVTEMPPVDGPWHLPQIESTIDPRFTNLETAIGLAAASFPPDCAKRIVIVSDGNENLGDAAQRARQLSQAGIGIDVVPIRYARQGDVFVEKLVAPADVHRGTPFDLRLVLDNRDSEKTVSGRVKITRQLAGREELVADEPVTLPPGKTVFTAWQELADAGFVTYEAQFLSDKPNPDDRSDNNSATAFSRVQGHGHVLLIEDAAKPGRYQQLVQLLRDNQISVTVRDTRRPFDNLADLQQFDAVILGDVPRIAGDAEAEITQFTDEQIHDLVQNTQHLGSGLIVLGGPNSYGAGGWTNSELEKALPVDFQIKSAKVVATGALALVIDSSGSMTGEKISWSKSAAAAASSMLGPRDYIGVVAFDSEARWIVPLGRNGTGGRTRSRIARLGAAGGTDLTPGMQLAYEAIRNVDASVKHIIVLTDGQTPPAPHAQMARRMMRDGITTSGVAVGPDADRVLLSTISNQGGGKFYHVNSPRAIPRIFMSEARRVAMPLVFEDRSGFSPDVVSRGDFLTGIDGSLPPITGYVLTTVKNNPLVEVLVSTTRQPPANGTILATWQFGLGRAAALTTDLGERWATSWPSWANFDKMLLQMVRWSMRSHDVDERLTMSTEVRDGSIHIVVTALDRDEEYLNLINLAGTVLRPEGVADPLRLEQVAPGRYAATIPASEPGNYFVVIRTKSNSVPMRTAVNIARTAEFDQLESNEAFLRGLAQQIPRGGEVGAVIQSAEGLERPEELLAVDVFRPGVAPGIRRDTIWPIVVVAVGFLFLGDVFCRRVIISFAWLRTLIAVLKRQTLPIEICSTSPMERLKQTKAGVTARFQGSLPYPAAESTEALDKPCPNKFTAPDSPEAANAEPGSYTKRLLDAKSRARTLR